MKQLLHVISAGISRKSRSMHCYQWFYAPPYNAVRQACKLLPQPQKLQKTAATFTVTSKQAPRD